MTFEIKHRAGMGGLFDTPLARPDYHDKIMAMVYERDFLRYITYSGISERVTHCGQNVHLIKGPEIGDWCTCQFNLQNENSSATATAASLPICHAAYQSLKYDALATRYLCEHWELVERKFLEYRYEEYLDFQHEWVFTSMVAQVSQHNQGARAGRHRNLDLGSVGAPRRITRSTLPVELSKMRQVLEDNRPSVPGEFFLLVPSMIYTVLMKSYFGNTAWGGGSGISRAVDGAWPRQLWGFNVIETNRLLSTQDSGQVCYYVLAGHRDAFAYASGIVLSRLVPDTHSFSTLFQMLAAWGGVMLHPDHLVMGYWHFDPISR
ncbi:MAG: hypothetical protein LBG06_06855 [Deltaproteobacteria bacterium]|jgi:hypothetical protein|nr:hypothetical protein [Deltaproteobacteria bacterium]